MSKKPAVAAKSAEAKTLVDQVTDVIIINGQKLIPVETSSYRTVDFREEQNRDAILYSGGLSKCLVVLIKNKGAEGKYDNVVTMMHFFPNNASDENLACENFEKGFAEFLAKCGGKTSVVSIQVLGGFVDQDQDPQDAIRGALIDGIKKSALAKGCKFVANEASITSDPANVHGIVFVNKDGTAIVRNTRGKSEFITTKRIASMGSVDSLVKTHQEYCAIATGFPAFTLQRSKDVSERAAQGEDFMPIESASDVLLKYQEKLAKEKATSRT